MSDVIDQTTEVLEKKKKRERMEQQVYRYFELKNQRERMKNEMDTLLIRIEETMRELREGIITLPLDEDNNLVAELTMSASRKLDKERMANDLGVEEKNIKTEFLIKQVEDRRLTFVQFKGYHYTDHNEKVSVRKKKIPKGKKKKGGK